MSHSAQCREDSPEERKQLRAVDPVSTLLLPTVKAIDVFKKEKHSGAFVGRCCCFCKTGKQTMMQKQREESIFLDFFFFSPPKTEWEKITMSKSCSYLSAVLFHLGGLAVGRRVSVMTWMLICIFTITLIEVLVCPSITVFEI